MSSVPRPRRPSKPVGSPESHGSQEPQRPPTPPTIAELLAVVRNARVYTAPTPDEITAAAQRHEGGGRLMAATIIQHMRAAQVAPDDEIRTYSLAAYLKVHGRSETLPERERAAFERRLQKQSTDPQIRASLGFQVLLGTVNLIANAFEAKYDPSNEKGRAALRQLYAATDTEPPHPALASLPDPSSYGERNSHRNVAIYATRILSSMLIEPTPAEQQADTSV